MPTVLRPLPDISMYIKQPESVWQLFPHYLSLTTTVPVIPSVTAKVGLVAPKAPLGGRSSSRRIFPLRLAWQAVLFSSLLIQFCDELLNVIPTDIFNWTLRAARAKATGVAAHQVHPLLLRDFGLAN